MSDKNIPVDEQSNEIDEQKNDIIVVEPNELVSVDDEIDELNEIDETQENGEAAKTEKKSKKPFIIVLILVAAFLVAITILQITNNVYKYPINNFLEAVVDDDTEKMKKALTKIDFTDNAGDYISSFESYFNNEVGSIKDIRYKVVDRTELNDNHLDIAENDYREKFSQSISLKKGYDVTTVITVKGDDGETELFFDVLSVKTKDGWKILIKDSLLLQ